MQRATILFLVALTLTGCNSPGIVKPLPYPEVMPVHCPDGRTLIRNNITKANPCLLPAYRVR
jgi:hypothetical protein